MAASSVADIASVFESTPFAHGFQSALESRLNRPSVSVGSEVCRSTGSK